VICKFHTRSSFLIHKLNKQKRKNKKFDKESTFILFENSKIISFSDRKSCSLNKNAEAPPNTTPQLNFYEKIYIRIIFAKNDTAIRNTAKTTIVQMHPTRHLEWNSQNAIYRYRP